MFKAISDVFRAFVIHVFHVYRPPIYWTTQQTSTPASYNQKIKLQQQYTQIII